MVQLEATEALLIVLQERLAISSVHSVEVIRHEVGPNWRQQHTTARGKVLRLDDSLVQSGPFAGRRLELGRLREAVAEPQHRSAISITSRVWDPAGNFMGHLALMNLHPSGFNSVRQICRALSQVTAGLHGYLLSSGRYFHYYGFSLLPEDAWINFLSQFLMPCVFVSPRYVGHSLYRRFCALRLNRVDPYKPIIPHVVAEL